MILGSGFSLVMRSWRMVLWLYGVNFLLGLLMLLPAYSILRQETGSSLEYLKLLNGFDYTVYADFKRYHGSVIDLLKSIGFWLGLLSLILAVFFSGGILFQLAVGPDRRQTFRLGGFLAASAQYVGRFFRLSLWVGGSLFLLAFFFMLVGALLVLGLSDTLREGEMIYVLIGCFLLFSFSALVLLCVGDYAKILLFRQDSSRILPVVGQAIRFVRTHFQKTFGYYLILVSMGTATFAIYFLMDSWIVASGWFGIVLLFLIQQFFIFSRVFLKVWTLATAVGVWANQERPVTSTQTIEDVRRMN